MSSTKPTQPRKLEPLAALHKATFGELYTKAQLELQCNLYNYLI